MSNPDVTYHVVGTQRDDHTQYARADGSRTGIASIGGAGTATLGGEIASLTSLGAIRNILDDGSGNATFQTVTAVSSVTTPTLTLTGVANISQGVRIGAHTTQTTTYAMTVNDFAVYADATGGAFNVTLNHTIGTGVGIVSLVKKIDSTANAVTVLPGSGTIDGASSFVLASQYDTLLVQRHQSGVVYILAKVLNDSADAKVATSESTASTSYTDLATVGPAVTVTTGTSAFVTVACFCANNTAGDSAVMGYAISGATTLAATDSTAVASGTALANIGLIACNRQRVTGLTAGSNTFTAKYKAGTGGTANFSARYILVEPI